MRSKKPTIYYCTIFPSVEFCIIVDEDAFAMFTKMKRLDGAQKLALYPKEYLTADIAQEAQTFDQKYLA